ncbi:hypothetical protein Pan216_18100 [Planctomycetes bacterium Pan216]|uniref:STAS domain-containing protein n=1 Tax=Kolteria novifilia TaxID=2527975 RepID=A0A518B1U8_9BACT|nr:hypothetical protein Pan216_18100 [Planctomycetes bacterium Pan216]
MVPDSYPVEVEVTPSGVTLRLLHDRLDLESVSAFEAALSEHLRAERSVVLDVSSLDYVDCYGFDALLHAIGSCPGKVELNGASTGLRSLFELAGLRELAGH